MEEPAKPYTRLPRLLLEHRSLEKLLNGFLKVFVVPPALHLHMSSSRVCHRHFTPARFIAGHVAAAPAAWKTAVSREHMLDSPYAQCAHIYIGMYNSVLCMHLALSRYVSMGTRSITPRLCSAGAEGPGACCGSRQDARAAAGSAAQQPVAGHPHRQGQSC